MTSYTRKLYSRDPAAAHAVRQTKFDRAQDAAERAALEGAKVADMGGRVLLRYGKYTTLACFTLPANKVER